MRAQNRAGHVCLDPGPRTFINNVLPGQLETLSKIFGAIATVRSTSADQRRLHRIDATQYPSMSLHATFR